MPKKVRTYFECPHCEIETLTAVLSARKIKSLNAMGRTRRCLKCLKTFKTREITDKDYFLIEDKFSISSSVFKTLINHPKIKVLVDHAKKKIDNKKKKRT